MSQQELVGHDRLELLEEANAKQQEADAQRGADQSAKRESRMLPDERLVAKATFRAQVLSPLALCAYIYFSLELLRFNFYLATFEEQLKAMGDDGSYTRIFPWIPPLGVVASPIFGQLMDRYGIFVRCE